jgi:SAM-dependent methyltransferase
VLEVGTGTGVGALWLTKGFPEAEVLAIDISAGMIQKAEAKAGPLELGRVRFRVADIAALEDDQDFDLVAMLNMPPFFEPVVTLLAPQGYVAWGASLGPKTPYFTPLDTLKQGFERRGVRTVETGVAGAGVFYLGQRAPTTEAPDPEPDGR